MLQYYNHLCGVVIARYDIILDQSKCVHLYNHLSNYTNNDYSNYYKYNIHNYFCLGCSSYTCSKGSHLSREGKLITQSSIIFIKFVTHNFYCGHLADKGGVVSAVK